MNIPKTTPPSTTRMPRARTLEEEIEMCDKQVIRYEKSGHVVLVRDYQQLGAWLRELQTLRAAMNMEPRVIHG